MRMKQISLTALVAVLAIQSVPITASAFHSLPDLDFQLQQYLGVAIGETGGARREIDRRLKVAQCPKKPALEKRNTGLVIISCTALNWRISVPLVAPRQFDPSNAANVIVIKRGQPVLMTARKGNFIVSRQMIADRNGAVGDLIPVRTAARAQAVLAEVTGSGRVKLPSPEAD